MVLDLAVIASSNCAQLPKKSTKVKNKCECRYMRSFADDAYQLNNLEACGITRQAAYNLVKSCEEAGESVYKFLQIVDCSEVGPSNKIESAKQVGSKIVIESATYQSKGQEQNYTRDLMGLATGKNRFDFTFPKSMRMGTRDGQRFADYTDASEHNPFNRLFIKYRCESGPLEDFTFWEKEDGIHVNIDCSQPKIQVQEATLGIASDNVVSNPAGSGVLSVLQKVNDDLFKKINKTLVGNRTDWLKNEAEGKSRVSTFLFVNDKEEPLLRAGAINLDVKYRCGDNGEVKTLAFKGKNLNDKTFRVEFSCMSDEGVAAADAVAAKAKAMEAVRRSVLG